MAYSGLQYRHICAPAPELLTGTARALRRSRDAADGSGSLDDKNYRKGGISHQALRLTLGNGLLTNNGDSWLHQRRLIQPVFHRERIATFGRLMAESALAWTEEATIDTSQPLDLFQEMSGLTLSIVGKALFGTDLLAHKERVLQASTTINHTVLISSSFDRTWLSGHKREASELTKLADAHYASLRDMEFEMVEKAEVT